MQPTEGTTVHRFALLHLGFRPFFLLGGVFAVLSVLLWMWLYHFHSTLLTIPSLSAVTWHAHEMIYGYALAIVAGFLLTAGRNWTDVQTLRGIPLLLLVCLWLLARIMPFMPWPWALQGMILLDIAFNGLLCIAVLHPVIKVRQWQQTGVASKLLILTLGNILFYLGLSGWLQDGVRMGLYTGLYTILSLILLMGRRVIPFFIEKGVGYPVTVRNFRWVDISSLLLMLAFILFEVFVVIPWLSSLIAALLFLLYGIRIAGWHTAGIWKKPLLWSLYLAYAWIAAGFLLKALSLVLPINPMLAIHSFAYGGVGLVTLGMMARVSLGHTGRNVFEPTAIVSWIFLIVCTGAVVRVLLPIILPVPAYPILIGLSQALWVVAFSLFVWAYAPMLTAPRIDGRYG